MITTMLAAARLPSSSIPQGGRVILADLGGKNLRLSATSAENGGSCLQGNSLSVKVEPDRLGHAITGRCARGPVDLIERLPGNSNSPMLTGSIGGTPVRLESRDWSGNETTITGYVGDKRVQVTQRHQLDGNVLTGYLGNQRLSLREREIPGQGPDLQPLEYLPILASMASDSVGHKLDILG